MHLRSMRFALLHQSQFNKFSGNLHGNILKMFINICQRRFNFANCQPNVGRLLAVCFFTERPRARAAALLQSWMGKAETVLTRSTAKEGLPCELAYVRRKCRDATKSSYRIGSRILLFGSFFQNECLGISLSTGAWAQDEIVGTQTLRPPEEI